MLDHALALAARGWPVFPCSPENKQPLTPKDSAPGAKDGGLYAATCAPEQIKSWWRRWPKAMIGVPTGRKIGAFVIDLDPRSHSAADMLEALRAWCGPGALPPCPVSRTQSGGLHLFFKMPAEGKLGNRAGLFSKIADAPDAIVQHVDVRGDGGYVIVPPSVMASGKPYVWEQEPDEDGFPDAPPRLMDVVVTRPPPPASQHAAQPPSHTSLASRPAPSDRSDGVAKARHRYAMAGLDREIAALVSAPEGQRGFTLNRAAFALGGLVGAGLLSETLVRAELYSAAERNGLVGKDGAERVRDTISRAVLAGVSQPIDVSQIGSRAAAASPRRSSSPSTAAAPPRPPQGASPHEAEADVEDDPGEVAPPPEEPIDFDLLERCVGEDLNDVGNANRLRHRFGQDMLHIQNVDFFIFDQQRWKEDVDGVKSIPLCHRTAWLIRLEALVIKASPAEQEQVEKANDSRSELKRLEAEYLTLATAAKAENAAELARLKARIKDLEKEIAAAVVVMAHVAARKSRRRKFSVTAGNSGKLDGMLQNAKPYMSKAMEDMNPDPCAINVTNGTVRLHKEGRVYRPVLHKHRREDFITKLMPPAFDPDATCPTFLTFLEKILPKEAVRSYVQRYFGYAMTALDREQVFTMFHGEGSNGKSTLIDAVAKVMGDYSVALPIASLVNENKGGKGSDATPDLARLPGARLVRSAEPKEGMAFDESLIKQLTSGEVISIRRLHKEFIDVYMQAKMIISCNRKPVIKGNDDGIWRRVLMVPFEVQIKEEEKDRELPRKLQQEQSGILNWLLEGCCNYLEAGLMPPDEVKAATQDYREDSDIVGGFIRGALEVTGNTQDTVPGGKLFNAFEIYCRKQGIPPLTGHTFGRRVKAAAKQFGFTEFKSSLQFYGGIVIRPEFLPAEAAKDGRGRRDGERDDD